jgi:hypothetical protein
VASAAAGDGGAAGALVAILFNCWPLRATTECHQDAFRYIVVTWTHLLAVLRQLLWIHHMAATWCATDGF